MCDQVCAYKKTDLYFSNPRPTLLQVLTADQQRAFCRIGAIIRGFLTRRLLKTEKVKHLRQTIVVRLHSQKNTQKMCMKKLHVGKCVCICLFRTHRSSSDPSRLKLHRGGPPTQHKTAPCRRESEPRYECAVTVYRQQRSVFPCVHVCFSCPSVTCSPV